MASKNNQSLNNPEDIPLQLHNPTAGVLYHRTCFLGKGGFAKCYQVYESKTMENFAVKVVSKKILVKDKSKEKMVQEIDIHKSLNHRNIVGFHSVFDDVSNIYMVLELCKSRSMMELLKRRKILTDPECRYYFERILQGVKFLHDLKIIHRDLKLGNIFLDCNLEVKIGDFGLATKIEKEGQLKTTLCGTPNYIAPEILRKSGYSFGVDIWSMGCILYTMLVGKPPFETKEMKATYAKIKSCDYQLPTNINSDAGEMIKAMLNLAKFKRPNAQQLISDYAFLNPLFIPKFLPVSSLITKPRLEEHYKMNKENESPNHLQVGDRNVGIDSNGMLQQILSQDPSPNPKLMLSTSQNSAICFQRNSLESLNSQLKMFLARKCKRTVDDFSEIDDEELSDPASAPLIVVSKWVDYSDKYGFGAQFSDESNCVLFNDNSRMVMLPNEINIHYIDHYGREIYMTKTDYLPKLRKKVHLVSHFKTYMDEKLANADENVEKKVDNVSRVTYISKWQRSDCATMMHLSNGSVQLNFNDHKKLILCPLMQAVSLLERGFYMRTYKFTTLADNKCSIDLYKKLRYAQTKIDEWLLRTAGTA